MKAARGLGLVALVLAASASAYAPSLRFAYAQDARHLVESNPVLERASPARIFALDYWAGTISPSRTLYRPVTILSFAAERRLLGESASWFSHAINILLHDLAALLLFCYARRLGVEWGGAAITAILFVVHPLMLQAVVNVVGRADLLAGVFSVAALGCLSAAGRWGGAPAPAWRHRIAAWGTAAFLFLALGSKEVALATPLLMLGQEWLFRQPHGRRSTTWWLRRVATLAPSGLALFVYVLLRAYAIGGFFRLQFVQPISNVLVGMEGWPRVATTIGMAGRYLLRLLWPVGLSGDYSGTAIAREESLLAPFPLAGLALFSAVGVLVAAPWIARRAGWSRARGRLLSMAGLLFALPYLTIGNVLVLNGAGFADRLIYVSSMGFLLALGALLAPVRRRRRVLQVLLVGICVASILHVRAESRLWENDEALFTRTLEATPGSLRAHFALAEIRRGQGRIDDALLLYDRALAIAPDHGASWLDRGILLGGKGELVAAEQSLRRSLAIRPEVAEAQMYLGIVLHLRGRIAEAERALRKALLLQPWRLKARVELAQILFETRRYGESVLELERCVAQGRRDLQPTLQRARVLAGG